MTTGARGAIGLVVHPTRPAAAQLARRVASWWVSRGYEVVELSGLPGPKAKSATGDLRLAISLGGDGTMLKTVQLTLERGVPVLGVNLGRLGYLTRVEPAQIDEACQRVLAGSYDVEQRMTLEVVTAGTTLAALNEVTIEKVAPGHTISLKLAIAGRPFLDYVADGLLLATPTGSTAYNLSLRGPILSPRLRALVVTPISPHMLFDRSLVLDPEQWADLRLAGDREAVLIADGSTLVPLAPGAAVTVRAGANDARIVRFEPPDFHGVLRHKFNLADR